MNPEGKVSINAFPNFARLLREAILLRPSLYQLERDPNGWCPVDAVIWELKREAPELRSLNMEMLIAAGRSAFPHAFELSDDKIRLVGSAASSPGEAAITAPRFIYAASSSEDLDEVLQNGLRPLPYRSSVHLFDTPEEAREVAGRMSHRPVVLQIAVDGIVDAGLRISTVDGREWLSEALPAHLVTCTRDKSALPFADPFIGPSGVDVGLLPDNKLPSWFRYPPEFLNLAGEISARLRRWCMLKEEDLAFWKSGLEERYPERKVIPFARSVDSDDIACWDYNYPGKVLIVHDFASSGWEHEKTYESFPAWLMAEEGLNADTFGR
ncbi:MAG: hypothetical protein IPG61_16205 [bacterium]|jgi:RNA:NAD 2'-phosphotransferase (TPT1/KptA family)|nr:hypothetical protein [bacterium]